MDTPTRFPISFDPAYARLSRALFLSPDDSYLELVGDAVTVRMGWGFRTRFARACITGVSPGAPVMLTRGVHGFNGRWLVNGAGEGIVTIDLEPAPRAYVMGFPIRLRQLKVSVADPSALSGSLISR